MDTELSAAQNSFAADRIAWRTAGLLIALPHALERERLSVGHQPLTIHRRRNRPA